MNNDLKQKIRTDLSKAELKQFFSDHENAAEILNAIHPQLSRHFPDCEFSLELCDDLEWTTEKKLLLNVPICRDVFQWHIGPFQ